MMFPEIFPFCALPGNCIYNNPKTSWSIIFFSPIQIFSYCLLFQVLLITSKRGGSPCYLCAWSTSLWCLVWEDREFSITCLEAYCFWFIFVLENARDQNTLATMEMGKRFQKELCMCSMNINVTLFIKACFTIRLENDFNQVRHLPHLCSLTRRQNTL